MNRTNFVQTGGVPIKAERLRELQEAYSIFNNLGFIAGNFAILTGCEVVGTNVSDGVVVMNGEVLLFQGGTMADDVIIVETPISKEFKDGTFKSLHFIRYATFGTSETSVLWSAFKRCFPTNLLTPLMEKLSEIEPKAEVNINSDYEQTDSTKKDFIRNKPTDVVRFLRKGSFLIGNVLTDDIRTVTFPSVFTSNYIVVGSLVSNSTDYNQDNDVMWMIRQKTPTSFKITFREIENATQNLTFDYILIPL